MTAPATAIRIAALATVVMAFHVALILGAPWRQVTIGVGAPRSIGIRLKANQDIPATRYVAFCV